MYHSRSILIPTIATIIATSSWTDWVLEWNHSTWSTVHESTSSRSHCDWCSRYIRLPSLSYARSLSTQENSCHQVAKRIFKSLMMVHLAHGQPSEKQRMYWACMPTHLLNHSCLITGTIVPDFFVFGLDSTDTDMGTWIFSMTHTFDGNRLMSQDRIKSLTRSLSCAVCSSLRSFTFSCWLYSDKKFRLLKPFRHQWPTTNALPT